MSFLFIDKNILFIILIVIQLVIILTEDEKCYSIYFCIKCPDLDICEKCIEGYELISDKTKCIISNTSKKKEKLSSQISSTEEKPSGSSINTSSGSSVNPPSGSSINTPSGSSVNPPSGSSIKPPSGSSIKPPSGSSVKTPSGSSVKPPSGSSIKPPSGSSIKPPSGSSIKPTSDSSIKPPSLSISESKPSMTSSQNLGNSSPSKKLIDNKAPSLGSSPQKSSLNGNQPIPSGSSYKSNSQSINNLPNNSSNLGLAATKSSQNQNQIQIQNQPLPSRSPPKDQFSVYNKPSPSPTTSQNRIYNPNFNNFNQNRFPIRSSPNIGNNPPPNFSGYKRYPEDNTKNLIGHQFNQNRPSNNYNYINRGQNYQNPMKIPPYQSNNQYNQSIIPEAIANNLPVIFIIILLIILFILIFIYFTKKKWSNVSYDEGNLDETSRIVYIR